MSQSLEEQLQKRASGDSGTLSVILRGAHVESLGNAIIECCIDLAIKFMSHGQYAQLIGHLSKYTKDIKHTIILDRDVYTGKTIRKRMMIKSRNLNKLPLPPGPKGYPFIGSVLSVPKQNQWLVYNEWTKIYGDMIYFRVLGKGFLVLNSLERVHDLFEKRSHNNSDRARMPMVVELMDWYYNLAFMPYGSSWRRHRKVFTEHFRPKAMEKYQPIQTRETKRFLRRLLTTPDEFMHHLRLTFAATIMDITYGIKVENADNPYVSNAEESLAALAEAGIPGSFLVDFFPILKYVPRWFPGAIFKRKAERWSKVSKDVYEKPFQHVADQMKKGTSGPNLASTLIENLPPEDDPRREEELKVARNVSGVAYVAGADTTISAVQFFFLAMAMYPEVQKKAQAEIDAVVGLGRLPEPGDRDKLPYVQAVVKESLRWHLVGPLAVAHTTSKDDEYDGYFIPKGTLLLGNAWAILHDPTIFDDPLEFIPERYLKDGMLDPNVRDPTVAAFGFGRRKCPGMYFADSALYTICSSVLAVYNITPPVESMGRPTTIKVEITSGLVCYPVPFKCNIEPRSVTSKALIEEELCVTG